MRGGGSVSLMCPYAEKYCVCFASVVGWPGSWTCTEPLAADCPALPPNEGSLHAPGERLHLLPGLRGAAMRERPLDLAALRVIGQAGGSLRCARV